MNIINELFNTKSTLSYFIRKILPKYPKHKSIESIEIIPHKKYIWSDNYHVVIEFVTTFINSENTKTTISIFCTAHSNENRKPVCIKLNLLWDIGFNDSYLSIPKAIHYSKKYNACFYEGVDGISLYELIKDNNVESLVTALPLAAKWFAKLHSLEIINRDNILKKSTIARVIPGKKNILERMEIDYPHIYPNYKKVFIAIAKIENKHLAKVKKLSIVHGDAHPENIISVNARKLGVIDFTDLCIADPARDIGTFTQQLEFMSSRKLINPELIKKLSGIFLKNYFKYAKIKPDDFLFERINNYYNWTTIRTATYFLTQIKLMTRKDCHNRAISLINQAKEKMGL